MPKHDSTTCPVRPPHPLLWLSLYGMLVLCSPYLQYQMLAVASLPSLTKTITGLASMLHKADQGVGCPTTGHPARHKTGIEKDYPE